MKLRSPLILSSDRARRGRVSKDDWIIDLGPEGGDKGGEIVAVGTPEEVVQEARSYTGHYLKPLLKDEAPAFAAPPERKKRASASMRQRAAAE